MFYLLNILIQMKILLNNQTLIKTLGPFSDIGFIPTMGGIHEGHISLINKSNASTTLMASLQEISLNFMSCFSANSLPS